MRYGLHRRLRRGVRVKIFPTFKCTLNCAYCGNKLQGDKKPKDGKTMTWEQWRDWIDQFPIKINEVFLSGGEPTLLDGFENLVNYLASKYLVTVYSNLTNYEKWLSVWKNDNIRIQATYHGRSDNKERFLEAYHYVTGLGHRVDVEEIAERKLPFSKVKPWGCSTDSAKKIDKNYFWISPDGTIRRNCYEVMQAGYAVNSK